MKKLSASVIAKRQKILKALQVVHEFKQEGLTAAAAGPNRSGAVAGTKISGDFFCRDSGSEVLFSLTFKNIGVGAQTKGGLRNAKGELVKDIFKDGMSDGIIDLPIGLASDIKSLFLECTTSILASNITPVPAKLQMELNLQNAEVKKKFVPDEARFQKSGDVIICSTSIIILA